MMPCLPDIVPNLLAFCTMSKCFLEPLYDLFHILMERFFRAVIIDEVLDNVAREFVNTGVYSVRFVDALPFKNDFTFSIHLISLDFAIATPCSEWYCRSPEAHLPYLATSCSSVSSPECCPVRLARDVLHAPN